MDNVWDCAVVGGGAAGLSAALVLGRARRRTLVVDAGQQSNRPTTGIGGLLGQDGRPPAELYADGHAELAAYPSITLVQGTVVAGRRADEGFVLELGDGTRHTARRVLLATGMDYAYRTLDGAAERWGRSVFHCPFCHGWEHRDEPLCVLDGEPSGVHRALLLRLWSDDVTLLTDGPSALEAGARERLASAGVTIDERPVAGLRGPGDELAAVVFADGGEHRCRGLLIAVRLHQRSSLAVQLGATLTAPGPVAQDAIAVDERFATDVPGLFAAGDASAQMPSVASAIATGHTAASMVVQSLL